MAIFEFGKDILPNAVLKKAADMGIGGQNNEEDNPSMFDKGKKALKDGALKSVNTAIKGSGFVIRKIYEAKINIVNEFSDIKPEWRFIDDDTTQNEITQLEKELHEALKLQKSGFETDVNDAADRLAIKNALLKNNLAKCEEIIVAYNLNTPFAVYGVKCLQAAANGDEIEAIAHAQRYINANNGQSEQPLISYYAAKGMVETGEFTIACALAKDAVHAYPEKTEIHRLLEEIAQKTGNVAKAKLQRDIIDLLD